MNKKIPLNIVLTLNGVRAVGPKKGVNHEQLALANTFIKEQESYGIVILADNEYLLYCGKVVFYNNNGRRLSYIQAPRGFALSRTSGWVLLGIIPR